MTMLNRNKILKLIKEKELVSGYIDLGLQLNPNGFDLTAEDISGFSSAGHVDFSNKERKLPDYKKIPVKKDRPQDKSGWWSLKKGAYKVRTNECVNIPRDMIALAYPRSTLLRMGAFSQNAVWDAGFCGKSEFILVVDNPKGIKVKQNARLVQLLFIPIEKVKQGYKGIYQNIERRS
jgi:dUTP pyrophosphatase